MSADTYGIDKKVKIKAKATMEARLIGVIWSSE